MDEPTPYLINLELIRETARQIIKDFGMTGIEIRFTGNGQSAYDELFGQIAPEVDKLLQGNAGSFYDLLYRIDISEDQLKKESERFPARKFSEVVAHLIIKRELQKVVIRRKFGKQ